VATVGFDLDLTLCDTRPGIVAAFAALAAESGVAVDGELIVTRLGPKLETELANWFPEERITEAAAIYRHHYATTCLHGTTALPGATELLERLVRSGHDIVVVTAKSEALARVCLDVAGLHADAVAGWVHGAEKAAALREHASTVYVGDTGPDMLAARTAECTAIGVTTGPDDAATLLAAGADHVCSSLHEVAAIVRSLLGC
jgi:phosphoglycolate phosphatase-like HAD superfamily hydrolase